MPPRGHHGAFWSLLPLPRLTLCRGRKGNNPLQCVTTTERHHPTPPSRDSESWGHPGSHLKLPRAVSDFPPQPRGVGWPQWGQPCQPQPTHPCFAGAGGPGAGRQLVQVLQGGEGGVHWANKGSRVCLPIQSGDRGSLSPFPGDYWVLGISRVSWPRGTESQLSSSKEGRERAWEVTECPEMRSPSPTTSPSHLLHPYWLGSQTAFFPPEAPKDKGCLSWTLRLP